VSRPTAFRKFAGIAQWFLLPALFYGVAMPWLVLAPFHGDDYVFLDQVARPTFHFADIWARGTTTFGWYRPWSRELHFWALYHVAHLNAVVFHVVNGVLWAAMLGLYALVLRRFAGPAATGFALVGALAAAIWPVPLFWASGSQDLWMLAFLMASLLAWTHGRSVMASLLLMPALLSKESAMLAPVLFVGYSLLIERHSPRRVVWALVPTLIVMAVWFSVHPTILSHLQHRYPLDPAVTTSRLDRLQIARLALLTPFNADHLNAEMFLAGLHLNKHTLGGLVLALLGILSWRLFRPPPTAPEARAPAGIRAQMAFGAVWWIGGCLPAFIGSVGWHSYYVAPGVLGAWVVLAGIARWRPGLAFLVLALTIGVRGPRLSTPDWDWGAFPAQERAGLLVRELRMKLLTALPSVPPHSRLFFTNVPRGIGFVTADGPLFRILYRDTTLRGGFWGEYSPRRAGDAAGTDYFLSFEPPGKMNLVRPLASLPHTEAEAVVWETDHRALVLVLGRSGDWDGAISELDALLRFRPQSDEYRRNRDYCLRHRSGSGPAAEVGAAAAPVH
jgi:hypothetical protein